ncbi:MAG: HAD-IIIA family hydrolase [Armatimonadetes bacterium]|nr:HAD-IIIA family hydrolase [Armatimonadota bacterium]
MPGLTVQACGPLPEPLVKRDSRPTLFLDRDGVLNVDHGYVCRREDFEWIDGAKDLLTWAKDEGLRTAVVTNQSGIGRGLYEAVQFLDLCRMMHDESDIDLITYCPHTPEDACPARKPGTGMLEAVDRLLGVDRARSFLIGDKTSDIAAADAFGVRSLLFTGGNVRDAFLAVY